MLKMQKRPMRRAHVIAILAGLLSVAPAFAQFDPVVLADAEGDGVVSQDEFTAYYALIWLLLTEGKPAVDVERSQPNLRAMILSVLPDARGTISRDEMLEAVPARYVDADKNDDGVVTLEEMKDWSANAMRAPERHEVNQ